MFWIVFFLHNVVFPPFLVYVFSGQIELYTHIPVMRQLVDTLQKWDFRICSVFLVDSQFMIEAVQICIGNIVCTVHNGQSGNSSRQCDDKNRFVKQEGQERIR